MSTTIPGYFIRILDYYNFPAFLRAVMAKKRTQITEAPISRVRKYLIKFLNKRTIGNGLGFLNQGIEFY
jgi:hypothetical protein